MTADRGLPSNRYQRIEILVQHSWWTSYTIGRNFPTTLVRHAMIWPREQTSTVWMSSAKTLPLPRATFSSFCRASGDFFAFFFLKARSRSTCRRCFFGEVRARGTLGIGSFDLYLLSPMMGRAPEE